jgi:hypothetical protein
MVVENSKESLLEYLLPRYFAHGLLFGFVLSVILLGLIVFSTLIGLIIGFLLLFLVFGAVNTFLMDRIWNITLDENRRSLLVHGFVLAIGFLAVSIPSFIISSYDASLPTTIVLFIIYCFIDGYVAKAVGSLWIASRPTGKPPIQLGFMGTLIVVIITAMAGTGFAIGLLLLVWSLLGGVFPEFVLYLTGLSGLVTLLGIVILSLSKGEIQEED